MEENADLIKFFKNIDTNNFDLFEVKNILKENGFIIKTKEEKKQYQVKIYASQSDLKYKDIFSSGTALTENEAWSLMIENIKGYYVRNY